MESLIGKLMINVYSCCLWIYDLIRDNSGATVTATVFILPGKITGFQMFGVPHDKEDAKRIGASDEILIE